MKKTIKTLSLIALMGTLFACGNNNSSSQAPVSSTPSSTEASSVEAPSSTVSSEEAPSSTVSSEEAPSSEVSSVEEVDPYADKVIFVKGTFNSWAEEALTYEGNGVFAKREISITSASAEFGFVDKTDASNADGVWMGNPEGGNYTISGAGVYDIVLTLSAEGYAAEAVKTADLEVVYTSEFFLAGTVSSWGFVEEYKLTAVEGQEYTYSITCDLPLDAEFKIAAEGWSDEFSSAHVPAYASAYLGDSSSNIKVLSAGSYKFTVNAKDHTLAVAHVPSEVAAHDWAEAFVTDTTKLISITGVVDNIVNTTYGNFDLVDPATGSSIYVYGLGDGTQAIERFSLSDSGFKFNNAKEFASLGVSAGMEITMTAYVTEYKGEQQLSGVLTASNDGTAHRYTASVSVNDETFGSATLSKSEDIAYGETVTVTPTPAEGYAVQSVKVNGELVNAVEGAYSFTATTRNEVSVEFVAAGEDVAMSSHELAGSNFAAQEGSNLLAWTDGTTKFEKDAAGTYDASDTNLIRIYKTKSLTVSKTDDSLMSSITITATSSYATALSRATLSVEGATVTVDGNDVKFVFADPVSSVTFTADAAQFRANKAVITY